jgi:hypothetical protein
MKKIKLLTSIDRKCPYPECGSDNVEFVRKIVYPRPMGLQYFQKRQSQFGYARSVKDNFST